MEANLQTPLMQTEQPSANPGMSMGGDRNAKNMPVNSDGKREWSNGLCSWSGDCGTCCTAICCPCIVYSRNKSRYEHLEAQGYPHHSGGDACGGDCLLYYVLMSCFGAGWLLQIGGRQKIRSRYNIEGGLVGDILSSCCCHSCALTQESRELELEEGSFLNSRTNIL